MYKETFREGRKTKQNHVEMYDWKPQPGDHLEDKRGCNNLGEKLFI